MRRHLCHPEMTLEIFYLKEIFPIRIAFMLTVTYVARGVLDKAFLIGARKF